MNQLERANVLINILAERMAPQPVLETKGPIYVGVDVGTANVVSVAVNCEGKPLAGEIMPARVVKEGIIMDYLQAVEIVRNQIQSLKQRLGRELAIAASAIPPGTELGNIKVTKNILEAADLEVNTIIDEPVAASLALGIQEGIVVDVGGGTTGISILEQGKVIYSGDEPTGGFQFDLVIAGHFHISTDEAEIRKRDPKLQKMLLPVVRPVMEKIACIIRRHLSGYKSGDIYLVGGSCNFPGFAGLIQSETGLHTYIPALPMLVTPLGIALACEEAK